MGESAARFCWYELTTTDTKGAEAFYRRVFGWQAKPFAPGEPAYTVFSVGPDAFGGMAAIPAEGCATGSRPCWTGYVAVDDVDAYAAKVKAAGGKVLHGPEDVPGVLRFAVVADPWGAAFNLFKGAIEKEMPQLPPGTPGHVGWHELYAGDGTGAFDFYSALFGWTKDEAYDMGPLGLYQTFATEGARAGGMMTKTPEMAAPFWLYYFNVEAVDAAVKSAVEAGAKVILEPHQVPGEIWIAHLTDPQGAVFAVVGARR